MATGPKIVHKQFNSPIGLYSQQNIKETLGKHLQNLDNGSVGIDFNNPSTDKPANLANSAVLRMLEEEERTRRGLPNQKKVVWPPVPETNGYHQTHAPAYSAQHSPAQHVPQYHNQYQPAQQEHQYQTPPNQYQQPSPQYQSSPNQYQTSPNQYQGSPNSPNYQLPSEQQQQASQPAYCEGRRQNATGLSKLIPVGPGVTATPTSPYRPAAAPLSPDAYRPQQSSRWAPVPTAVPTPHSPQNYGNQPSYQQSPYSPQPQFELPPSTITLRPQQPIHQRPPPVFSSQPATASFNGGVNMRGDTKWPPQNVKEAVEAENEARRMLAKGPACRPRKINKDYSSFFAQNALNNNYPGYRAPPGTQHYEDNSGRSSY